jgi:hypothetical protein
MADEYQERQDDAYRADCAALVAAGDEVSRLRAQLARAEEAHAAAHERLVVSAARVSRAVRVRRLLAALGDEWCTHDVLERIFSASAGDVRTLCALACVCRAFRDEARNPHLWVSLRFEERRAPTLAEENRRVGKLTDDRLLALAARGGGELTCVELHSCRALTYAGLKRLVEQHDELQLTLMYCELQSEHLARLTRAYESLRLKADGVPLSNAGRAACLRHIAKGDYRGRADLGFINHVADEAWALLYHTGRSGAGWPDVCIECFRLVDSVSLGCEECHICRICFDMLQLQPGVALASSVEQQQWHEYCIRHYECTRCAEADLTDSSDPESDEFECAACDDGPDLPACADCGAAFCASCADGALCGLTRLYDVGARDELFCQSCLGAQGKLPDYLFSDGSDEDDEMEPQPRSAACRAGPSAALLKATRAEGPLEARQLLAKRRGRA